MKKRLIIALLLLPSIVSAGPESVYRDVSGGFIRPINLGDFFKVSKIVATSTASSTFAGGIDATDFCTTLRCLSSVSGGASLSGGSPNTLTYWLTDTTVGATSSPTVGSITATSTTATSTLPLLQGYKLDLTNATSSVRYAGGLTNSNFNNMGWIKVYGKYAYATSYGSGFTGVISVIDISNPNKPVLTGQLTGLCLTPEGIEVSGKYAYVACYDSDQIKVVDISSPASPTVVGTLTDGTYLNGAEFIFIAGQYAYVTSLFGNNLAVVDISNPTSPIIANSTTTSFMNSPIFVKVKGKYAYITNSNSRYVNIFDISNPLSITSGTNIDLGVGNISAGIDFKGNYAYISNYTGFPGGTGRMFIADISNPLSPTLIRTLNLPTGATGAIVSVQNNMLYGTNFGTSFVSYDISSSTNPIMVNSLTNSNIQYSDDIFLNGNYAYVTDQTSNTLNVIDVSGFNTPSIQTGTISANRLDVEDFIATQRMFVNAGLSVGNLGILNQGSIISSTTISNQFIGTTTATSTSKGGWDISGGCFAISGTCIGGGSSTGASTTLLVDSNTFSGTNNNFTNNLGVGTSTPYAKLSVVGQTVAAYFTATTTSTSTLPNLQSGGTTGLYTNSVLGKVAIGSENYDSTAYLTVNEAFTVQTGSGQDWFAVAGGNVTFNSAGGSTRAGGIDLGARFNIAPISDSMPTLGVRGYSGGTNDIIKVSSAASITGDYMIVKSTGNIGIGTTSPWSRLSISQNPSTSARFFGIDNGSNKELASIRNTRNATYISAQSAGYAADYAGLMVTADPAYSAGSATYILGSTVGGGGRIYFAGVNSATGATTTLYSMNFTNVSNWEAVPSSIGQQTAANAGGFCPTSTCSTIGHNSGGDLVFVYGADASSYITNIQGGGGNPNLAFKSYLSDTSTYKSFHPYGFEFNTATSSANMSTVTHSTWRTANTDIMTLTPTGRLGLGTSSPSSTLDVYGSVSTRIHATTTTTTLSAENKSVYIPTWSVTTFTINLPTSIGIAGREYDITNSATSTITIDPSGTETIMGTTTSALYVELGEGESITIQATGSTTPAWIRK